MLPFTCVCHKREEAALPHNEGWAANIDREEVCHPTSDPEEMRIATATVGKARGVVGIEEEELPKLRPLHKWWGSRTGIFGETTFRCLISSAPATFVRSDQISRRT